MSDIGLLPEKLTRYLTSCMPVVIASLELNWLLHNNWEVPTYEVDELRHGDPVDLFLHGMKGSSFHTAPHHVHLQK